MKKLKILLISLCMVAAMSLCLAACGEETKGAEKPEYGTVTGTVTDEEGEPVDGAEVFYTDADSEEDDENSVETDEDGKYEIKRVKLGEVTLKAVYSGYADNEKQLTADDFDAEGAATANFVLEEGKGTVKGTVSMAGNTVKKLEGVTVSIGTGSNKKTTTTDASGSYELTDVPMLGTKTLSASLSGYEDATKTIKASNYVNGVATVAITLTQNDLPELPGLKPYQLEQLEALTKATYTANEISSLFGSAPSGLGGTGKVETHGEGYCVNANTSNSNENMVAYVYAKLNVTESNKFLTAYSRIFYGQNGPDERGKDGSWTRNGAVVAKLQLYAFELGADGSYTFLHDDRFGAATEIVTESFMPVTFDLTSEVGKTVVFVLGTRTGYHCVFDRIEFGSVKPEYLTVTGVNGLTDLRKYDKVTGDSFDADALKEKWATGGGTSTVEEGIQLNGTDPWKAVDYDAENPQPVNSYMYILTDLDEAKPHMTVKATIVKLADTYDTAQDNKQFLPYFCVIVLDATGNNVYQSAWTKLEVEKDKDEKVFDFDLTGHTGENMTVIIAANVGYRATITGVSFGAAAAQDATPVGQPAILPTKRED